MPEHEGEREDGDEWWKEAGLMKVASGQRLLLIFAQAIREVSRDGLGALPLEKTVGRIPLRIFRVGKERSLKVIIRIEEMGEKDG